MKIWSLVGMLVVLASIVPLVIWTHRTAPNTPAVVWMIGFSTELDRYAGNHEGRFPESFGDLILEGDAVHASNPADPWRRAYVYERHHNDPRLCRVYTLGDPLEEGRKLDSTTIALYRVGGRSVWRQRVDDLPTAWREATLTPEPVRQP